MAGRQSRGATAPFEAAPTKSPLHPGQPIINPLDLLMAFST